MLAGMLAGAAIGAAAAMFYTPASGQVNRQRLVQWIGNRAGDAKSKAQQALPSNGGENEPVANTG